MSSLMTRQQLQNILEREALIRMGLLKVPEFHGQMCLQLLHFVPNICFESHMWAKIGLATQQESQAYQAFRTLTPAPEQGDGALALPF